MSLTPARRSAALRAALVALLSATFVLPLVLLVAGAFRRPGLPPPIGVELFPAEPSFEALQAAFSSVPLARSLFVSAALCAVVVPLTLVTASWAAMAILRASPGLAAPLVRALFLLLVVPQAALWVTRFAVFQALGLVGTYVPLVAPALMGGSPLYVLLYVGALRRIPSELFDAARLEGLGPLRVWWRVALPLTRPTSSAVGLLAFIACWSNFVDPLLYLDSESSLTAPAMLHSLELLGPTHWPVLLAGAWVVSAPVVVLFLASQRWFLARERGAGWVGR